MRHLILAALAALSSCVAPERPEVPVRERFQAAATAIGDAAIRLKATAYLNEKAPFLLPVIDTNRDQTVSLDELLSFDTSKPETWALLLVMAEALR